MTQTEALRLALEALEKTQSALARCMGPHKSEEGDRHRALAHSRTTITSIEAALANEALERKAENARELGLDYEPMALKPCAYESKEKNMCRKCGQVHAEAILDTAPPVAPDLLKAARRAEEGMSGFDDDNTHDDVRGMLREIRAAIKAALEAKDSDKGKVDKLRIALMKANNQAEHFECEWYLRGDEIERLKAALEAKDEPVAWMYESVCGNDFVTRNDLPSYAKNIRPLYTTPPQRTWVGLTDEDIGDEFVRFQIQGGFNRFEYAVKAIEAKLKEKNG